MTFLSSPRSGMHFILAVFSVLSVFSISAIFTSQSAMAFQISDVNAAYTKIVWTQLMPADDLAALLNPPDFLADIPDGASNDNLDALGALGSVELDNTYVYKD